MYTSEHAARLQPYAGQKWRPSNGCEGDFFMCNVCASCSRGPASGCDLALAALVHDITADDYPSEWQIGHDGLPTCTAWEPRDALSA